MELTESEQKLIEALRNCKITKCNISYKDSWDYNEEGLRYNDHKITIVNLTLCSNTTSEVVDNIVNSFKNL